MIETLLQLRELFNEVKSVQQQDDFVLTEIANIETNDGLTPQAVGTSEKQPKSQEKQVIRYWKNLKKKYLSNFKYAENPNDY